MSDRPLLAGNHVRLLQDGPETDRAMFAAILGFFLSMVPIGPPLVWGGAAIWLFYQGSLGWAIFMVAWGLVAISSIDDFVKPYLISRGSSLPILLIVFGVFGGVVASADTASWRPGCAACAGAQTAVAVEAQYCVMNIGMHIDNEMRCKVTTRTVAGSLGPGVAACRTMSLLPPPPPPWWWLKPEPPRSGFLYATRAIRAKLRAGSVQRCGCVPDAREQ